MDNQEKLATLHKLTRHRTKTKKANNTTQITKKMSNTVPTKNRAETWRRRRENSSAACKTRVAF